MFFLLILNVWTMDRLVSTRMHQGKRSISVWRYIIQDGALGKVGIFVIFLNRTLRQVSRFTIYFLFRFPFTVCTKSACLYGFLICIFHISFCMFMKVGIMYTTSGRVKNMLAALIM